MAHSQKRTEPAAESSTPWEERVLGAPRGKILALLRGGPRTVDDLARELGVTPNAVRVQMTLLERDGIARRVGSRPTGRKPAALYGPSGQAERLFPKAYGVVLRALLDGLRGTLRREELEELLRRIGRRLAGEPADRMPEGGRDSVGREALERRVRAAARALEGLGAVTEVERRDDAWILRGLDCPLAEAVRGHPEVCLLAESLVEELTGVPVRERCDRDGAPRCLFEIGGGEDRSRAGRADPQKS